MRANIPWRPGARELLDECRQAGVPTALVTMSWRRFADAVVQALPEGSFTAVITGDEVSKGKPDPEPYLVAARTLGFEPSECYAVEDSPTGVRSAVAAGCRTLAVPCAVELPLSSHYRRLDTLEGVTLRDLGFVPAEQATGTTAFRRPRNRWTGVIALAVVGALAAGGAWWLRQQGHAPLKDVPVHAWAPYWVLSDAAASVGAHGSALTSVSPFWYQLETSGAVSSTPHLVESQSQAMVTASTAAHATLVPTVSDTLPAGGLAGILADPERNKRLVDSLTSIAAGNGGVDLDFEQFTFADDPATWETTRPLWISFLTTLSTAIHGKGRVLSVTVPPIYDSYRTPDSGAWVYDYAAMEPLVDQIRVMAYDYSVTKPGPIAPLDWTRKVVRAAKSMVKDPTKIVLGVPLYGRNWVLSTSGQCPDGTSGRTSVKLNDVAYLAKARKATPVHDDTLGESSFTYTLTVSKGDRTCSQLREVHYVDELGVRARIDVARKERIGGVVFWAIGFDNNAVWDLVKPVARPHT
jgi:spore germination protein YaaH